MVRSVWRVLRDRGIKGLLIAVWKRIRNTGTGTDRQQILVKDISRDGDGVDIVGFFTAEHGVGEAARTLFETLNDTGVKTSTVNYTDTQSRTAHSFVTDDESRHHVLICSINAEQLVAARNRLGGTFFSDRYVIGQWFWELEQAPTWYEEAWEFVDELWAPTRFIESMLRRSAPVGIPIAYCPLPIRRPEITESISRDLFGIDERFTFLFVFDLMSVMKRKNPLGLIQAFMDAFKDNENVQLIIKTVNGELRPLELTKLEQAASSSRNIRVINQYFSREETSALIASADCYVSLHRSEGLGITLMEAMSTGVPTIATGYSGNLDFMNADNSYLIDYEKVRVGDGAEGYNRDAVWAEPDLKSAAAVMRHVFENYSEALDKAAKAQKFVLDEFSVERTGVVMKNRLEEIWNSRRYG